MTNLEILEFKQTIISYTNQIQLPVEVKRMVFKEILDDLHTLSNQEVRRELEERKLAEQQKVTDTEDNNAE